MIPTIKYQIRSGGLQPVGGGCPTGTPTSYVLQTFGALKSITNNYDAKELLLKSADFQGLKPGNEEDSAYRESTFVRASYSGRPLRTTDGTLVYQAQEEMVSEFVEESEVQGWEG